jgi:pimeloyl-ACP methyl ester carboxylesterase
MTTIELPDGRRLEIDVTGPEGAPVMLFVHGTPGSSLQLGDLTRVVQDRGHRLVTWSRAGYGVSSRRPGRDVASETRDAAAVLDHVGADSCVVAGWSGGGPHALACGALLPDRVRAVTTIAGVAPYDADGLEFMAGMGEDNVVEFGAALEGEESLRTWLEEARPGYVAITADEVAAALDTLISTGDRASLTGEFAEYLAGMFRRAVSVGVEGWLDDDLAFTRPWGFDVAAIEVPTYVWQGGEDLMVPFAHGEWLGDRIPGATPHLEHRKGHLEVLLGALDVWVDELIRS